MPLAKASRILFTLFVALGLGSCSKLVQYDPDEREVYDDFKESHLADSLFRNDNPASYERFVLGRKLFFDPDLSANSSTSCVSCHLPERAFADFVRISPGVHGPNGFRNSPTLINVGSRSVVNMDGGILHLDLQPATPIEDHDEMDISLVRLIERLSQDEKYQAMSLSAYDRPLDAFVITRALGQYCRSLVSRGSLYDDYISDSTTHRLTATEMMGMELFFSDRLGCSGCHGGRDFTDESFACVGNFDGDDQGRARITTLREDQGKFKVPTLRNIALTRPYMHDGSVYDLRAAMTHPLSIDTDHPNLDERLISFELSEDEILALEAFLHTLTDSSYLAHGLFVNEQGDVNKY